MAESKKGPWGTVRISRWIGSRLKPIETILCPTPKEARRVAADVRAKGLHADIARYGTAFLAQRSKATLPNDLRR